VFKNLDIQKKTFKDSNRSGYKVYSSATEFVLVEAETAAEAIEKAKIENPVKIEKTGLKAKYLLNDDELSSESLEFTQKESQFVSMDDLNLVNSASEKASETYKEEENIVNTPTPPSEKEKLDIEA
jgi:hypothetical protein